MRWLLGLALLFGLVALGLRHLPPEWDPRRPLDLTAAPNALTGLKLRALQLQPDLCPAAFTGSGLPFLPVPDRPADNGCAIEHAVRLTGPVRAMPANPVVTCPLAAAWTLFERNTLQPEARQLLGTEVTAIRHYGTYACRNVNHAQAGRRSQHATANAIDIAGFVLRDGREVKLAGNWGGSGPESAFLHALRDGACRWFRGVLGPEYNAAHHDHFHLDMGPWRICR
ncbi:extensin-like domain-containing protein [Rhodovastum atsumiense]|nr:extensin family protein [Rhodovastum atsumiense]